MTHFAEIKDDIVINVIVAEYDFVNKLQGEWIQTSYNTSCGKHLKGGTPLRGNYAGTCFNYDRVNDLFLPPKPYPSFVLNIKTASWEAPTDVPLDEQLFSWDESTSSWGVTKNAVGSKILR